ncbi:MAG TPA: regulatory protein RecX [Rhodanobacteraceae bacterium]|nr:regulatory protein RecX [Rhodanobacteraceae bacterium]
MPRRASKSADKNPRRSAYDRALGMLARREHSQRELRARLEHGGYDEIEAADAIKQLGAQSYQDDDRFAEMLLRARVAHGYGPARIRAELRSHGLAAAAIDKLIATCGLDWNALATAQLRKKYGHMPAADHAERGKRAAFLMRRGFAAATVRAATHAEIED